MSSDNPELPSGETPPRGESDGKRLGGGGAGAGAKPLTPQELREQRLARLGGTSPTQKAPPKKPPPTPPSTSTTTSTSTSTSTSPASVSVSRTEKASPAEKKKMLKSPPTPTNATASPPKNKSSSTASANPSPAKPSTTKKPSSSPVPKAAASIVEDDGKETESTGTRTPTRSNVGKTFVPVDAGELAAQEAEDLQTAIALSMGISLPPSTRTRATMDSSLEMVDPLPASIPDGKPSSTPISHDLLATAAMLVATAPETALASTLASTSTAPSTPMQIEEEDNDVVMKNGDKKPAAVETKPIAVAPAAKPISPSRIVRSDPQHFSGRVRSWYNTAAPFNVLDFHDCMWDKDATTENDQKRWLAQGIKFKAEHDDANTSSTRTAAGTLTATNEETDTSSLLAAIISGPGVWCLTQQHGGPCGVLASIQAELLAILLFGPRTVHPLSMISIDFPTSLSTEFTKASPDMSRSKLRQALALSMGIILARASLKISAHLQDDTNTKNGKNENTDGKGNDNNPTFLLRPEPTVTLVLPKNELWDTTSGLEWEHLGPWVCRDGGGGLSEHLLTYTVSLNKHPWTGDGDSSLFGNTAVKRQKHNCDIDMDQSFRELAHATAQFLLETNSLNWFQRPGGVLLMVMSVAASRGIPKLQGDMDDLTAKLTATFGHCSQELINLLLTGQAVSNVFDGSRLLSGELTCRGIQSQPAIGYLTQLEASRHVEVGGFYKTPRFPIWVIGSTSHFTIMFGDGSALKESASDALLEKVRRAFKTMEGNAEENGFIVTGQLRDFLKSVGLSSLSDHEEQMLAFYMDRYGAGIILWDDLWKITSRVLTGASIESILVESILDEANKTNNNNKIITNIAILSGNSNQAAVGAATDPPLSDEELARKLQAEWNGIESMSLAEPSANVDSISMSSTACLGNPRTASTEKFGHTFQLYHYNGLRGGNFKAFRVTRLSADEAIGASVSLGNHNQASHVGGSGGELDSVLRTKWPGCKINWISGSAPSIN